LEAGGIGAAASGAGTEKRKQFWHGLEGGGLARLLVRSTLRGGRVFVGGVREPSSVSSYMARYGRTKAPPVTFERVVPSGTLFTCVGLFAAILRGQNMEPLFTADCACPTRLNSRLYCERPAAAVFLVVVALGSRV